VLQDSEPLFDGSSSRGGRTSPAPRWTWTVPWRARLRAVQATRFGGPEVMDVVDLPDPVPADGETLYDVSSSGVDFADTHHRLSRGRPQP
jgi:hypothetical protein